MSSVYNEVSIFNSDNNDRDELNKSHFLLLFLLKRRVYLFVDHLVQMFAQKSLSIDLYGKLNTNKHVYIFEYEMQLV